MSQKAKGVYKSGVSEHNERPKSKVRDKRVIGEECHSEGDRHMVHTEGEAGGEGMAMSGEGAQLPTGQGEKGATPVQGFFSFLQEEKKQ